MEPGSIICPKCGSNQITANEKGFSGGKAIVGDVLLGPVGLLAGMIGKDNIVLTCLNCGMQWEPQKVKAVTDDTKKWVTNDIIIFLKQGRTQDAIALARNGLSMSVGEAIRFVSTIKADNQIIVPEVRSKPSKGLRIISIIASIPLVLLAAIFIFAAIMDKADFEIGLALFFSLLAVLFITLAYKNRAVSSR